MNRTDLIAVLTRALREAPHSSSCRSVRDPAEVRCDCWRFEAIQALHDLAGLDPSSPPILCERCSEELEHKAPQGPFDEGGGYDGR